jgi:hypothetical protein
MAPVMSNTFAVFTVAWGIVAITAAVMVSIAYGRPYGVLAEQFAETTAAAAALAKGDSEWATDAVLYAENPLNHAGWPRRGAGGAAGGGGSEWSVRAIDVVALSELVLSVGADAMPASVQRGAKSVLAVMDPADATRLVEDGRAADSVREIGLAPTGYFVTLTSLSVAKSEQSATSCSYDWRGKRIGYLERSDLMLIKAILKGYRVPMDEVTVVKIPVARWDKLADMLESGEVYRIVAYVVPNSAHLGLIRRQRVYAQGFAGIDADRVSAFYPFARLEERDIAIGLIMDRAMSSLAHVLPKDADGPVFAMRQSVMLLAGEVPGDAAAKLAAGGGVATGAGAGADAEGFVGASTAGTGGKWTFAAPEGAYDGGYKCFGNLRLENKAECESRYDTVGDPKPEGANVWDRPCFRDSDCPFWNEESAKIGRGGCAKGACEMAVGAKATGFRKYEGTPFCYGCTDPAAVDCCERQGDAPDYAFAGDYEARRAAGSEVMLVE